MLDRDVAVQNVGVLAVFSCGFLLQLSVLLIYPSAVEPQGTVLNGILRNAFTTAPSFHTRLLAPSVLFWLRIGNVESVARPSIEHIFPGKLSDTSKRSMAQVRND